MLGRVSSKFFSSSTSKSSLRYLTRDQVKTYEEEGYLVVKNLLPPSIRDNLSKWSSEIESWEETPGKWMKYFEYDKKSGQRLLCRIENFLPYFPQLKEISYGLINDISSDLFGEEASVYKEKINFKFPHGSGFNAHQDQPAFVSFGIDKLLTVLLPIDPNTRESGGLDMVRRVHKERKIYAQNTDGSIQTDLEANMTWIPVDGNAGDVVFFDSFVPHRSDVNKSRFTRRNLYLTYNPASLGNFRDSYYEEKRRLFPPECERDPTKDYSEGAKVFNVANPIK
jgi:ectoine hydroxylase-related dioxygenase (phytanoyl-CoA dioxygenase family)